jgi:hypothetical protein
MGSMDRGMTNIRCHATRAHGPRHCCCTVGQRACDAQNPGDARRSRAAGAAPEAPTATLDKVLVVGSNIRDATGGGASPVIVIDKEAIDRTGAATVQQLFEKLPQNFGGGANGATSPTLASTAIPATTSARAPPSTCAVWEPAPR